MAERRRQYASAIQPGQGAEASLIRRQSRDLLAGSEALSLPDQIEQQRSLAEALGERGKPEEGVRHLERAYALAKNGEDRKEVAALLADYRSKFNLGQLWQFVNVEGKVFYESTNIEEIREQLLNGKIPSTAKRRKNRVGEPLPIADWESE